MQAQAVEADQPSLDVSAIELSERFRRVRNPSNLALLANLRRGNDETPKGVTLNAVLEYMSITSERFDEASKSPPIRITTFVTSHHRE